MNTLIISLAALLINIPLGIWRRKYKKFSFMWFFLIHASIPLIIPLRIWLDTPKIFIPLFIGFAVLGQLIGSNVIQRF
ncbi:MAG: hypothetical protein LBK94_05335 [Prevotellaceae bacterium]|jgi:hypothetical protein|nr:hypothetical protein [Prevotellaceae bacterium]